MLQMAGKEVQIVRCNLIECLYTATAVDGSAQIVFSFSSVDASLLDTELAIPEEANAPSCDVNDGVAEAPATTFFDVTNDDQEETMFTRTMDQTREFIIDRSPNTSTNYPIFASNKQYAHRPANQSGRDRANAGMYRGAADGSTNSWRPEGIEQTMFASVRNGK
jgi:hypothetical protein